MGSNTTCHSTSVKNLDHILKLMFRYMRLHLILTTISKSIYIIIILRSLDTRKRKLKEDKGLGSRLFSEELTELGFQFRSSDSKVVLVP